MHHFNRTFHFLFGCLLLLLFVMLKPRDYVVEGTSIISEMKNPASSKVEDLSNKPKTEQNDLQGENRKL